MVSRWQYLDGRTVTTTEWGVQIELILISNWYVFGDWTETIVAHLVLGVQSDADRNVNQCLAVHINGFYAARLNCQHIQMPESLHHITVTIMPP